MTSATTPDTLKKLAFFIIALALLGTITALAGYVTGDTHGPCALNPPTNTNPEDMPCANPNDARMDVLIYPCVWLCNTVMFDVPGHESDWLTKCEKEHIYCLH